MIVIPKELPDELALMVPTYYGHSTRAEDASLPDFDSPHVPVLVLTCDGVRVVLGSHASETRTTPEVQIERRPNGWAIFLMPCGEGDESGYVFFLDDGRSFLVPNGGEGVIGRIEIVDDLDDIPELDKVKS